MDNFDKDDKLVESVYSNKYFKNSKQSLQLTGLWPFQNKSNVSIFFTICFIFVLNLIANARGMIKWCGYNLDLCTENMMGTLFMFGLTVKLALNFSSQDKLKVVIRKIAQNWITLSDFEEKKIIINYAELGRIKSLGYFVYVVGTGIVFAVTPLNSGFLDLINPLNESRPKRHITRADYIVDSDIYFYEIHGFMLFICVATVFVTSGIDNTYNAVTHQNLAMLAIVKHRLQKATQADSIRNNREYDILIEAIQLHKESIKFTGLIESTYSLFCFIMTFVTIIFVSTGAIIGLYMLDDQEYMALSRLITLEAGCLIHFFYLSWPGQLLLNESENLFMATYTNQWYNLPKRSKTILRILMLKLLEPSRITAGGLLEMNFTNCGLVVKNAVSYLTVAVSFRN